MTKNELVSQIAEDANISKKDAEAALNSFTSSVKTALSGGQEVRLVGFGTFKVSERKAREGRNPQTGAPLHIPASKMPSFKAGKELKDALN